MDENLTIIKDVTEYLSRAFIGKKPIIGAVLGILGTILFPIPFYRTSFIAVMIAAMCDVVTKNYAICKKYGGYKNSVKLKKVFSKTLWRGTEVKLVSYLAIALLTGLSYNVVYLEQMGIFIASFVYSVMFMREFQSNIENLIEAGADLHWLLLFSKKKNKEMLKHYEEEKEASKKGVNDDYEERI